MIDTPVVKRNKTSCFIVLALEDGTWVGPHVWRGLLLWTKFKKKKNKKNSIFLCFLLIGCLPISSLVLTKSKCNQHVTHWRFNSNITAPFSCFEPQSAAKRYHSAQSQDERVRGKWWLLLDDVDSFWQLLLNPFNFNFCNLTTINISTIYPSTATDFSKLKHALFLVLPKRIFPQLSLCLKLLELRIILSTGWWLNQPLWKICQLKWMKIFPNFRGENIWVGHHPENICQKFLRTEEVLSTTVFM